MHGHPRAKSCSVAEVDLAKNKLAEGSCRVIIGSLESEEWQCQLVQCKELYAVEITLDTAGRSSCIKCAHGCALYQNSGASKALCTAECSLEYQQIGMCSRARCSQPAKLSGSRRRWCSAKRM